MAKFEAAIRVYGEHLRAQAWLERFQGGHPLFSCIFAFTETALIPGISAAGATPESRQFTALADAEFLVHGPQPNPVYPLPPLTAGASPALLTRALLQAWPCPPYLFNAGLPFGPSVPMIDLGGQPTQCLTTGQAMGLELVEHLAKQGQVWGAKLSQECDYLVLAECVVGGTTTALGILEGLGIQARQRMGSSHVQSNQAQKWEIVQQGLKYLPRKYSSLELVATLGDAMQIVAAAMVIEASQSVGVLLAGGSQMVAVYALAQALVMEKNLAWHPENVVIGTTRWIAEDMSADVVGLAEEVGVPLIATELNLSQSKFPALQAYEQGFVKEGVGAGGAAIATSLSLRWGLSQLEEAIEAVADSYLSG